MGFIDFVSELKTAIPSANQNITDKDYLNGFGRRHDDTRPVMPQIYEKCSWGLLLPTVSDPHRIAGGEDQYLFILNLFSPAFLHPLFIGTEAGLTDRSSLLPRFWMAGMSGDQDQADKFKNPNFPNFYKAMLSLGRFFYSSTDDMDKWTNENAILAMACILFDDLKKYHSKSPYMYHREYLDMCVILETMLMQQREPFNALNISNRANVLLGQRYPDSKSCFAEIYHERNGFVHGKTFKEMKRYSMDNMYSDSTIAYNDHHFKLTTKAQGYLRRLLAAYLYVYKRKKSYPRLGNALNLKLISKAAGNLYLRKRVKASKKLKPDNHTKTKLREIADEILALMP